MSCPLNEKFLTYSSSYFINILARVMSSKTEDKLRKENTADYAARLEAVMNTVIDGIITINHRGIIQSFNPSAERIFGYTPEEVIGQNVKMLMPEPYHSEHNDYIKNYLETGEGKVIGIGREVEAKRKDGTIFPMELGINEMTISGQRMFVGTIRDISDRKKAEEAMRDSEAKIQAIVDNTVDGLITIDEKGRIETFNKACETIFGFRADEATGQNVKMLMPEPYYSEHDQYLKNYNETGDKKIIGIGREVEGKHKDGTVFPIDLSVSEVQVQGRKLYSGIVRDITDRKKTERELISVGRVLEESLNEIFIFDAETLHFVQVNKGARENLGYSMEELKSLTPLDIKPEYTPQRFNELIAPLKTGQEKKIIFETIHRRKNGTDYDIEVHLQLSQYQGKKAFVATVLDITDRKRAEDELLRSNEELERFAYVASHDLQEPLRMVANFTALLQEEYYDRFDEQGEKYMAFIIDSARRMQGLVADLLEYSRIGQEEGGFSDVDCKSHTELAVDHLQESIEETDATITIGELPVIYANPLRFSRLMQNLIGNAIKYRKKDVPPEITVKAEDQGNKWLFSITDNGIGMKEEYLEKIFVIFKRLHGKHEYKGTGIGLAICKKIIESFDGRIWAESKLGEGTTFYFTVPKKKLAKDAA